MSLKDVRRHHQSSVRSKEDEESADVATTSPGQDTGGPGTAGATLTRADSASCAKRAVAVSSEGTAAHEEATFPSPSRANRSRDNAELRLSNDPAHHTTAWCFARVSATYASRRSSPRCSSTCCATWPFHCGPSSPTSMVRTPAASWNVTGLLLSRGIQDGSQRSG